MVHRVGPSTVFALRALIVVCLIGLAAPAWAAPLCSTSTAPNVFPGSTEFNNTVRAQMWYTEDDIWWGAFSDASSGIYFYRRDGGEFVKGDLIDANFESGQPDALPSGLNLFILVFQSGSSARLYKYTYTVPPSKLVPTYVLDPGFPVDLPLAGLAEAIALHRDSTGKVWATYTSGRNVHVIWSTSSDHRTWNTTGTILAPDIDDTTSEAATIVHFGGDRIGVVWGNQARREIAFRFHRDGDPETVWSEKEIVDCCQDVVDEDGDLEGVADDHLSLRAGPDGRLFLIAKDSIGAGRLHLYIRCEGKWGQKTIVEPDPLAEPTRPILALDVELGRAYVFYRNSFDGHVYLATSDMTFPEFQQCIFMEERPDGGRLSNVTTTKQNVAGFTGLVLVASRSGRSNLPDGSRVPLEIFANNVDFVGKSEPVLSSSAPPPSEPTASTAPATTAPMTVAVADEGTPIADFEPIWAGRLWTSTVPRDDGQWRWLRRRDVTTIVNLDQNTYDLKRFAFDSFLWVPVGAGAVPADAEAQRFLKFIQVRDNQPAHISSGTSDRRALMVGLLRYAIDGWTMDRALTEAQRLNQGVPLAAGQVQWLQDWAARNAPGSHRLVQGSTP